MAKKSLAEKAVVEGEKTGGARACDSCISNRARWYCAADDAFLCQPCDASVHSANSLARRHDRVRLHFSSSFRIIRPSWHHGFTKKPRTPRQGKTATMVIRNGQLPHVVEVPELSLSISTKDETVTVTDEHLLHRVPVLAMESKVNSDDFVVENENDSTGYLSGIMDLDMDPSEFAADVESLMGNKLHNECFDLEELGLANSKDVWTTNEHYYFLNTEKAIKIEMDQESAPMEATSGKTETQVQLSLDSEAVIIAWGSRGTPWTSGDRPNFDVDHYSTDSMNMMIGYGGPMTYYHQYPYLELGCGISSRKLQAAAMGEGEREAKVSRYREKRRSRLFAKKIRYQVRKLNAEKRPRLKGRFVKRSSCSASL